MDSFGWLRILRDTTLIDNKLTVIQADAIFNGAKNSKVRS